MASVPLQIEFGGVSIALFAGLGALGLVALGCLVYSCYARYHIARQDREDRRRNEMRREELDDRESGQPEKEWQCSVCRHVNPESRGDCLLCWTPRVSVSGNDSPLLPSIPRVLSSEVLFSAMENGTAGEKEGDSSKRPLLKRSSSSFIRSISSQGGETAEVHPEMKKMLIRTNSMDILRTSFEGEKRQRALQVRRANQLNMALNQRQKGAKRRTLWKREKDEKGVLQWVRTDISLEDQHRMKEKTEETFPLPSPLLSQSLPTLNEDQEIRQSEMKREKEKREEAKTSTFVHLHQQAQVSMGFVSTVDDQGNIRWVPATAQGAAEHVIDISKDMTALEDHLLVEDDDLEGVAALSFAEKNRWFLKEIRKITHPIKQKEPDTVELVVHRETLLEDSVEQLLAFPVESLRKRLRVHFMGEAGLDAGGLMREWGTLVSQQLFDETLGLFQTTTGQDLSYWINPSSINLQISSKNLQISADTTQDSENSLQNLQRRFTPLQLFEFAGRFIGKMILEEQLLTAHLALPLLKHLLGVPISFSDLEFLDQELFSSLQYIHTASDVEDLCLDFTVTRKEPGGETVIIPLKDGGANIPVTQENKEEYLFLLLRYYMLDAIAPQLAHLMTGLYEAVPKSLVSVFDYQELELLLNGLETINVDDWEAHTDYQFRRVNNRPTKSEEKAIQWFWAVVRRFSAENRARLLQYVTGTSRVPVQGFRALLLSDGHIRRFTIRTIGKERKKGKERLEGEDAMLFPKSHTCFNRLDLPLYASEEELETYLRLVINMEIVGFGLA